MKKIHAAIIVTLISSIFSCKTSDDPGLAWLLALGSGSTAPAPSGDIPFDIGVGDVQGSPDFLFDTARTIPVFISVRDPVSPITGSLIQVLEKPESGSGRVIFQAVTTPEGTISGTFTISKTEQNVGIVVNVAGKVIRFSVDITNVQEIRRFVFIDGTVTPIVIVDRDNDGVPDANDAYPDDATRAAKILVPSERYYTVAFEDLYPSQGDADFNDYVVKVTNEEDLNAKGEVVRIRGSYTHIACGAGYKYSLRLKVPATGQYSLNLYNGVGALDTSASGTLASGGYLDIFNGLNSQQTLPYMANTTKGKALIPGMKAEFELVLDQPVTTQTLSAGPFDLYIYVLSTSKEIHFLGRYFKADGKDQYLDSTGFPWALMIAGPFKWPYEKTNITSAYAFFDDWYISLGLNNNDWFSLPNLELVFPFE